MRYKGKITTTGSSEAIRLDKNLFKQHPEFKQSAEVRADVIAPGKLLISVQEETATYSVDDPVLSAFLSFIENDMQTNPESVIPLDRKTLTRAKALFKKVKYTDKDFE